MIDYKKCNPKLIVFQTNSQINSRTIQVSCITNLNQVDILTSGYLTDLYLKGSVKERMYVFKKTGLQISSGKHL